MDFKLTRDHDEIRSWIEERGGKPALKSKSPNQRGVIDISFGVDDPDHELVTWEEFFDTFDALNLEFRYVVAGEEKQYAYTFIPHNEAKLTIEDELDAGGDLPEDDVPIENIIPSAPSYASPDGFSF